jgi:hypothetical protein
MPAYRVPHPHNQKAAHRQTRAARWIGVLLLWAIVLVIGFVADRVIPPQHLPWKTLKVIDPVGLATKIKAARAGEDGPACRAILTQGGIDYVAAPEQSSGDFCRVHDALELTSGLAPLKPARPVLTCKEALAVTIWERKVVQTAAFDVLGQGVVAIDHYGSYACRRIYDRAEGPVSEHASANALDIAGFRLADGTQVSVEKDWNDPGPKGAFLHKVRDGACQVFITVLSPDYNAEHANHLHLDMGGWAKCA